MKHLLPFILLLALFLTAPCRVMAQGDTEACHAYFTLGDNRELPFTLSGDMDRENSYSFEFSFEPHWKGSQVIARFSEMPGAYTLRINQFQISDIKEGESPVEFNITPFLHRSENKIELVFDSSATSVPDRFSESTLLFRPEVQIRDMEITTYPVKDEAASLVRIQLYLKSYQERGRLNRTLALVLIDTSGHSIYGSKKDLDFPLAFGQETEVTFDCNIEDPILWGPDHPDLYRVQLHLVKKGMLRGELLESHFGIHSAVYMDSILLINGDTLLPSFAKPEQVQALSEMDNDQVLSMFKENNYNGIRADSLLPARIMNLFDRNGILVLRKSYSPGVPCFKQDRNRPSVIIVD